MQLTSSRANDPVDAVAVAGWIERYRAGAVTVLDAACGTGELASLLMERGFEVFAVPDIPHISAGPRYDAILCLSNTIAYERTAEGMRAALTTLAALLDDNGVLLIEPWATPTAEMLHAFEDAGFDVVFDATGISGRGLYVAKHRRTC